MGTINREASGRDWLAVRPPSRASLAPTVECGYLQRDWSAVRPPSRASLAPTRGSLYTLRSSPLIRPSVSSPAALDLDLPAPFGRLSGGVHPGSGAQRRSTQSNTLHVGRREADRRAVSPDGYRSEGTPSLSEGPDAWGETFWFLLAGPALRAFDKRDSP